MQKPQPIEDSSPLPISPLQTRAIELKAEFFQCSPFPVTDMSFQGIESGQSFMARAETGEIRRGKDHPVLGDPLGFGNEMECGIFF